MRAFADLLATVLRTAVGGVEQFIGAVGDARVRAHSRSSDPSRGEVLDLAVDQFVIVLGLGRPLVFLFISPVEHWPIVTHLILSQVVTLIGIHKLVHLRHEVILMVTLLVRLSIAAAVLPRRLSCKSFLR